MVAKSKIYNKIPFLIAFGLYSLLSVMVFSVNLNDLPGYFFEAATFDFLIVIPVVFFVAARRFRISKLAVIPIAVFGLILASLIIPENNHSVLENYKAYVLPFFELGVLTIIFYKLNNLRRAYHSIGKQNDFTIALRTVLNEEFKGLKFFSNVLAVEISIIYFVFFKWRKPRIPKTAYTSFRENGMLSVLYLIVFLVLVETFVFHILIVEYSMVAAYILTALSIYSGLQVLGIIKSIPRRYSYMESGKLYLRLGILAEADIPITSITEIERNSKDLNDQTLAFNPLNDLSGGHNIILGFSDPIKIRGFYGRIRETSQLAVYVDDPDRFVKDIYIYNENTI